MGSFSLVHWIIVLVLALVIFGSKRLTSGLGDLGKGIREFKKGMNGDDAKAPPRIEDDAASRPRTVTREDERSDR